MASQSRYSDHVSPATSSFEVTQFGQFMRMNPPTFIVSKVEEYPQGFIDDMEKIFRVMYASDSKGDEFAT